MSNYLKIESKQPDLNPCPIHQNHINFDQSNQKYNEKFVKTFMILLYLFVYVENFKIKN